MYDSIDREELTQNGTNYENKHVSPKLNFMSMMLLYHNTRYRNHANFRTFHQMLIISAIQKAENKFP